MVIKKFNWLELAQKIHATMDWCQIHVHRFWWMWSLWFQRYSYSQKRPNFPFWPWTILMIPIHVLFISSVRVANVLFLCHCTTNHLLTSLLINFFTSIHPSLIHLTLIPSIPYSSHSYSVHHLFTSLLINLFTSIHPSLIIHSRLVTSSYVHLWDPVFVLVSHQHTITSLLYILYSVL